jgi:8-hydroxy-5-deazaflavin:NADPH oxidoreductase
VAASIAPGSQSGSNDDAAAFGELLLYAPRNVPPSEVLSGVAAVAERIVLDCSNHQVAADLRFSPIAFSELCQLQPVLVNLD